MTAKEEDHSARVGDPAVRTAPAPYRSTPVFDQETLPSALRGRHATKAGVWGLIRVIEGKLRLTYLEPSSEILLDAEQAAIVLPEQPHFVTPQGPMKMQVDFYDRPPG
jgi:tellurite resistance-related uncharacterized protein